jgi:hypothetical protein
MSISGLKEARIMLSVVRTKVVLHGLTSGGEHQWQECGVNWDILATEPVLGHENMWKISKGRTLL